MTEDAKTVGSPPATAAAELPCLHCEIMELVGARVGRETLNEVLAKLAEAVGNLVAHADQRRLREVLLAAFDKEMRKQTARFVVERKAQGIAPTLQIVRPQ